MCCSFQLIIEVILFTGYAFSVVENDAPAKPTYLRLPVVDRKVHITTFTHATFSSGSSDPSKVVVVCNCTYFSLSLRPAQYPA